MPDQVDSRSITRSMEDFLKTVYALQQKNERVSTNALAGALNISAPSVTDMAQRLVDEGLVDYRKYYGVRLTDEGERIALKMVRVHRLIELYLVQELGYALHEVHDEAERLEHAVSDRFIAAISHKLGDPRFDPHGDPIPTDEGVMPRRDLLPLSELGLETQARISRFRTQETEMLQHITERGLHLGMQVCVLARDPFEGPLQVRVDGHEYVIGHNLAASIMVEPLAR